MPIGTPKLNKTFKLVGYVFECDKRIRFLIHHSVEGIKVKKDIIVRRIDHKESCPCGKGHKRKKVNIEWRFV